MAIDANPVQTPAISVHGSQAPTTVAVPQGSGKPLPPAGNAAAAAAKPGPASAASNTVASLAAQVTLLNKYLNDSGRPDQYRVAPDSDSTLIQEVNPATGAVIAEYPAISFPALARSLGISSALIDAHA
jgi:outer membrane biosynthesis protein TonB